jgi:hypothetical protein
MERRREQRNEGRKERMRDSTWWGGGRGRGGEIRKKRMRDGKKERTKE